jgi:hypothetical protein
MKWGRRDGVAAVSELKRQKIDGVRDGETKETG